jgi:hypothetical protein
MKASRGKGKDETAECYDVKPHRGDVGGYCAGSRDAVGLKSWRRKS